MRTEIFIEGYRLDVGQDLSTAFTYAIDDIKDFASRNTAFSRTIIIPGNANNNKLFNHVFEFGRSNNYIGSLANVGTNYNAARAANCVVYVDKIQIFKGVLRLLEIVIDNGIEYECAVFGELGGFMSAMGNKLLEDLNFSAYNHGWTIANIQASWDAAPGSGYYYPLIDYGSVSSNKLDFDIKAYRPALYVREYIDKIITGAGYTYEAGFFDSALFKRLIIPNNQKSLAAYTDRALSALISSQSYTGTGSLINIKFGSASQLGSFTLNGASTVFTYGVASNITASLSINITGLWLTAQSATLQVKQNGSIISSSLIGSGGSSAYFSRRITIENITIAQGDQINLDFSISSSVSYQLQVFGSDINITSNTVQLTPINYGETIQVNNTIPRGIFQRDFFSSIVKMFNLYVTESSDKAKHLLIKPYIDYYNSNSELFKVDDIDLLKIDDVDNLITFVGPSFIDWSYKIDRSKPRRIKPMSELNGRYFEFKYKQDSDYLNDQYYKKYAQGYGDRLYDSGYEFAKEKQSAEIIFAATPLVSYAGRDKVLPTIYKLTSGTTEESTEHIIRILQAKKISGVVGYNVTSNGSPVSGGSGLTSYGYAGHLDDPYAPGADINFGAPKELSMTVSSYPSANLFNGYWSDYIAEITDKDSKLLSCYLDLNDRDIYSLDFAKLIYIDGNLWRLNRVIDYNPGSMEATKCELLKVIEIYYA